MTVDVLGLLDRQYGRLLVADGVDFVHELRGFYQLLTVGPPEVTGALTSLRLGAAATTRTFEEHDQGLIPELVALRNDLVARAPAADDSSSTRPKSPAVPSMEWAHGLANFDELATGGPDRVVVREDEDPSAGGMMLRILQSKLRELQWTATSPDGRRSISQQNLRPDLDELSRRVRNLEARHRHAAQEYGRAVARDGGFQIRYLDMAAEAMNPTPREVRTDADRSEWIEETFRRVAGGWQVVEDAYAGRPLDVRGRETLDIVMSKLKPAADRVYEDLRLKIATAPAPSEPARGYGRRLRDWVLSPAFALVGGPCVGAVLTGAVSGQVGSLAVFAALAAVLALLPPLLAQPPSLSATVPRLLVAVLITAAVAAVLAIVGLGAALAALVLLLLLVASVVLLAAALLGG